MFRESDPEAVNAGDRLIGTTVSHYKILEKIGAGGMSVVYKAEDTKLGRAVALKFLAAGPGRSRDSSSRFLREAKAASALDHPNICSLFEIDETEDGQLFIAMAYYEGQSLRERIDRGPLPLDEALDVAIQIAQGLSQAHARQIVHRDIKPANIVMTVDGLVKIVDFGVAKLSDYTMLTGENTLVGTLAYMSPEQIQGKDVDHRTDVWALGIVLYEMLSGRHPFSATRSEAVMHAVLNEAPPPIAQLSSGLPNSLIEIVNGALQKDEQKRLQEMSDVLTRLQQVRAQVAGRPAKAPKPGSSIAVLPFANMSADPENEYFSDGLAEELINALSKIEGLRVVARTSAFSFKGKGIDVRTIGRKLNVGTVVEGGVQRAGGRLRITVRLTSVADGYNLWSERYDREWKDIFAIQDEISMSIVEKLNIQLLKEKEGGLVKSYTDNLEAYSLYLRGLHHYYRLTREGLAKSYECYRQAIALDRNYALAQAGLAVWHSSLAWWGSVPPHECMPKAREAALKAMELDDSVAMAHSTLGIVCCFYEWNRPLGYRRFQRSLDLEPGNAFNHVVYGLLLATGRQMDEAVVHATIARKLDPFSSIVNSWVATILASAGQLERAIFQLEEVIESDPKSWQAYFQLCALNGRKGDYQTAIPLGQEAVSLSGGAAVAKMALGCSYALSGQADKAAGELNDLRQRFQEKYVPPTLLVWLCIALQKNDEAYKWLEAGVENRDPWLAFYDLNLWPDRFRADDPRFEALLKTSGAVP